MAAEEQLYAWLQAHGARFDALRLADFPDGRGLAATRDLAEGDELLRVPERLFVCDASAAASQHGELAREAMADVTPAEQICVQLVAERELGARSFYAPWLQLVPREYTSGLTFRAAELERLRDGGLVGAVRAERERLRARHRILRDALRAAGGADSAALAQQLSWRRFLWAWCTLQSRGAHMPAAQRGGADGGEPARGARDAGWAIVPYGDMFNHRNVPTRAAYDPASRAYVYMLACPSGVRAGCEVHVQYGAHPSAELLLSYGFVPRENEAETVVLPVALGEARGSASEQEVDARRAELLLQLGLSGPPCLRARADAGGVAADAEPAAPAVEAAGTEDALPWSLLTAVRIAHMREDELPAYWRVLGGEPISVGNELRALSWLRSQLDSRLRQHQHPAAAARRAEPGAQGGARAEVVRAIDAWHASQRKLLVACRAAVEARLVDLEHGPNSAGSAEPGAAEPEAAPIAASCARDALPAAPPSTSVRGARCQARRRRSAGGDDLVLDRAGEPHAGNSVHTGGGFEGGGARAGKKGRRSSSTLES